MCRVVAWKWPVVSHDVWFVCDTIYVKQTFHVCHNIFHRTGTYIFTFFQKFKSKPDSAYFLPLYRAVAWKRTVISHDVWVVRDTIYVQQTSCWLPWHMENRKAPNFCKLVLKYQIIQTTNKTNKQMQNRLRIFDHCAGL